jgi:predicted Zn-dependent protease with MMP-like domain
MIVTSLAPSLDDIEAMARSAWDEMPATFRAIAGEVVFHIEDFADEELLAEMGIEDPFELSGVYHGVDLTQASIMDPTPAQPMVFLFRRAILDEWIERGDVSLADLVAHVLIHEIGHHFGLSDDAMDAILELET